MTGRVTEPADAKDTPGRGPRHVARRVAQGLYYGFVVFVAASAVWQITAQIYFPPGPTEPPPFEDCRGGLLAFYGSIDQARAASRAVPATGDGDPEEALRRYRANLEPLWRHRQTVASMCRGTRHEGLLDAIEQLRYSEEHSVRHQAHELTALRRRVSQLVAEQLPSPEGSDTPPTD